MKAERIRLAMAKKVNKTTTVFECVQHATVRTVMCVAAELAMKGFTPVGKPQKVVVEI
jgi:hypothetical protein